MEQKYNASVAAVNCEQMKNEDIHEIMRQVLYEFPITEVEFFIPKWVEMLSREHRIKKDLLDQVRSVMGTLEDVRSIAAKELNADSSYIREMTVNRLRWIQGKSNTDSV